jgi:hypothetical protein
MTERTADFCILGFTRGFESIPAIQSMLSQSQKHWPLDTEYFETNHTNFKVDESMGSPGMDRPRLRLVVWFATVLALAPDPV